MLKCDRNNSNLTVQLLVESHSLENSRTLIGYLGEVFSVDLRLLKARLCVIFHFSDNKTTSEKQSTVGKKNGRCTFYHNTLRTKHSLRGTKKAKFSQYLSMY